MAKQPPQSYVEISLYEARQRVEMLRLRRQRALFIPKFIKEAARHPLLSGSDQDKAYAIAVRWADLESSGALAEHKETSIDTQFLDQLFGDGLGYELKTTSPNEWQLEHKFSVFGVGTADAALGEFPAAKNPTVVIELKDAQTDLDRDRFSGRTAVQQCWDYLNALPDCPWGLVSNSSTIRLYHRAHGTLRYEEFSLQELRDRNRFNQFYCLFERGGLLRSRIGQKPRALALLQKTQDRQKEVGDDLYEVYQLRRLRLIEHLKVEHGKSLDAAIRIAQMLLDRIIFIAFCEDRELLPEKSLERAYEEIPPFARVTNPRWRNFLDLFAALDKGAHSRRQIPAFNGGLFRPDPEVDELQLDDDPWAVGFKGFGIYDFSEEVNVDVLGHIFERSITELEKLRVGGLFALQANMQRQKVLERERMNGNRGRSAATPQLPTEDGPLSKMPKSAQRKRFGIYYTPPAFTGLIVERTVDATILEEFKRLREVHDVNPEAKAEADISRLRAYWLACLNFLQHLTICDPACGSGAFLIRAYDSLDGYYKSVTHGLAGTGMPSNELVALEHSIPDWILSRNLFGVDLSLEAVEITQLALWIRSARVGSTLADLSKNILHGNSLIADPAVDPRALNWAEAFPAIFKEPGPSGFSCIIGNPPWERVKVQEREFFSLLDPTTAQAVSAADRRKRIARMPANNAELHASYEAARAQAQRVLDYARAVDHYPLTGKGDINTYMLFAELAMRIVAPYGRAGLLLPSGIATDATTKDFFRALMENQRIELLYDFENRERVFEDVDSRFKFSAFVFGGADRKFEQADFVFFAHAVEETSPIHRQRRRHAPSSARGATRS